MLPSLRRSPWRAFLPAALCFTLGLCLGILLTWLALRGPVQETPPTFTAAELAAQYEQYKGKCVRVNDVSRSQLSPESGVLYVFLGKPTRVIALCNPALAADFGDGLVTVEGYVDQKSTVHEQVYLSSCRRIHP